MKKMMMILMLVVTIGAAAFADSYVAFTDNQPIEIYESNEEKRAIFDAAVKERFACWATLARLSNQEKKDSTHIIVINETDVLYEVWVYTDDSKIFGIAIVDADGNTIGDYHYEASSKTDPVLVGLNFVKEIVFQVNNIDKGKVVYSSYAVEPIIEEQ